MNALIVLRSICKIIFSPRFYTPMQAPWARTVSLTSKILHFVIQEVCSIHTSATVLKASNVDSNKQYVTEMSELYTAELQYRFPSFWLQM